MLSWRPWGLAVALSFFAAAASAQPTPVKGGVLNAIVWPEPPNLNLALQQVAVTQMVASKVYESLLTYSTKLEPMPSLAKSWSVSSDRRSYTFNLQKGVKWHDGKPFSSADVVFSYKKVLVNSPRTRNLMDNVADVTAPDANTVVFKLKQPYSAFLYSFDIGGGAILPQHLYDVATEIGKNPHNNAPVGTGPFKFSKWERGSYIELVRNADYWRLGLPYLDGITYRVIPDAASRRIALEQGLVHQAAATDIEPSDARHLDRVPHLRNTTDGNEYWAPMNWIEFNNSVPPFNDKRFRQALMYALNRNFIVSQLMVGQGKVATGPIHQKTRFYSSDVRQYEFDIAKAKQLLDAMGLKPDANGVRVTVSLIPMPYGELYKRIAEYVKQSFSKVGVKVTIESTDIGGWVTRVGNGDFQMAGNGVFQYGDPAIGVARTYVSTNIKKGLMFSNTSQYRNPEVDALFAKAASAPEEERQALYTKVQQILVEDVPVLWFCSTSPPTILNTKVHDAIVTGLGFAGSYAEAWLEK